MKQQWCIAPEANGQFVWHMEDVLEVYTRPYDTRYPQVCMDETNKQLLGDTRAPLPMEPGRSRREDGEYERHGVGNIFLACEPLAGKRFVQVTKRRTNQDWADFMRDLIEVHYPKAEKIILVMDNLSTHSPAALYQTFPAEQARRFTEKLEIHLTPKHGSWLNMAEIELAALSRQCLCRRISSLPELAEHVVAWQEQRNQAAVTINWRFTTDAARIKLKRLYPAITPADPPSP